MLPLGMGGGEDRWGNKQACTHSPPPADAQDTEESGLPAVSLQREQEQGMLGAPNPLVLLFANPRSGALGGCLSCLLPGKEREGGRAPNLPLLHKHQVGWVEWSWSHSTFRHLLPRAALGRGGGCCHPLPSCWGGRWPDGLGLVSSLPYPGCQVMLVRDEANPEPSSTQGQFPGASPEARAPPAER